MSKISNIISADAIRHMFRSVVRRFPFPFFFATALTVWLIYVIAYDFDRIVNESLCWTLSEGFLLTLAINLWCSFSTARRVLKPALLCASALVAVDLVILLHRGGASGAAENVGRSAFTLALASAIFFLPSVRKYSGKQLWVYTMLQFEAFAKAFFIAIVMAIACLVIFGTMSLLFSMEIEKAMTISMCVMALWLPCVLYLSNLPLPKQLETDSLPTKTIVGAFCKNVILPLVVIYTFILYVYAAKILFTWTLPKASVTWMVTGLMVTVLIMLYGLRRYSFSNNFSERDVRISSLARKWLPVILLPLLVLMSVGLIYRVREYGITVSRLYVAAFNVWAYSVVLYLIIRRNANLNVVAVSYALVFALVSMIPGLNFTSISNRIIRSEIFTALRSAGVENFPTDINETRAALATMTQKEARDIASKIAYLDDWNDHSNIADIVKSDDKIYAFEIVPDQDNDSEIVEVAQPEYTLSTDDYFPVEIPGGYRKLYATSRHNVSLDSISDGIYIFNTGVNGFMAEINVDSLSAAIYNNSPLAVAAVNGQRDSAMAVFTELIIDMGSRNQLRTADYFIFTK